MAGSPYDATGKFPYPSYNVDMDKLAKLAGLNTVHLPGMITMPTAQPARPKPEYQTKIKSRVSVPLDAGMGRGAALEMTVAGAGDMVDFTLILPGRQATNFSIHRKDIEALVGELTLDKLSK